MKKGKHRRRRKKPTEDSENDVNVTDKALTQGKELVRHIAITEFITEDTDLLQVVKDSVEREVCISRESIDKCSLNSEPVIQKPVENVLTQTEENEPGGCAVFDKGKVDEQETFQEKGVEPSDICFLNSDAVIQKPDENVLTQTEENEPDGCAVIDKGKDVDAQETFQEKNSIENPDCCGDNGRDSDKPVAIECHQINDSSRLALVGLHTCGNLSPSSLKLFMSNPAVSFLCNVGCCYHLMEEEFCCNPFMDYNINQDRVLKPVNPKVEDVVNSSLESECGRDINPMHPSKIPNLTLGFPLSKILRDERFALGRNARMLSCQPADRLNSNDLVSLGFVFFRFIEIYAKMI